MHGRAPGLHHRAPVGLLVVARADHEDLALEPEQRAGERERGAPLAGAGLRGELLDPGLRVLVGLRHRGVGLVRARGRDALVLVEDLRRGAELLLEAPRAVERRRPPQPVGVAHGVRDRDLGLRRDLLHDQRHREDRREVLGPGGLPGPRIQRRERVTREVSEQVDPVRRDGVLAEDVLRRLAHRSEPIPSRFNGHERNGGASDARCAAAVLGQRHVLGEAAVDVGDGGGHCTTYRRARRLGSPWWQLASRGGAVPT